MPSENHLRHVAAKKVSTKIKKLKGKAKWLRKNQ